MGIRSLCSGRGRRCHIPPLSGNALEAEESKDQLLQPCWCSQAAGTLCHPTVPWAGGNEALGEQPAGRAARPCERRSRLSVTCHMPGRALERGWPCVHGCGSVRHCWVSSHTSRHWDWDFGQIKARAVLDGAGGRCRLSLKMLRYAGALGPFWKRACESKISHKIRWIKF